MTSVDDMSEFKAEVGVGGDSDGCFEGINSKVLSKGAF